MTRYLIDSNVLIESNNHYYGIEFCLAFWDWLVSSDSERIVASINNVAEVVSQRNDAVSKLSLENKAFFLSPDDGVKDATQIIGDWVRTNNFRAKAISEFSESTDNWLVAYALVHDYTVVTQEVVANTIKKVKVPNVCNEFKVHWMNTFQMLRNENPRFVSA